MKTMLLVFLVLVAMCPRVDAQGCTDTAPYKEAREIVQDLERIVTPSGIQESYKTKIGGIDQWLNVRGQDRANPIVLFIHGDQPRRLRQPSGSSNGPLKNILLS